MIPDREKVIEGLENLRETIRTATQYTFTSGGICAMNMKRIDNAISLLKEQEHKDRMYHALEDDWKRLKELLKEQEAVAPILIREGRNKNYNDYVCPRCDNEVVYEQNYCSECGVQFLWEGR